MSDNFSASGLRVQTPCGPRKSGMPESVEMPAPVNTTMRLAESIQPRAASMVALLMMPQSSPLFVTIVISLELVELTGILDKDLPPGRFVRRPPPEEVVKLYRAHLVLEGKMRIVAPPDQAVGRRFDERRAERQHVGELRIGGHAVDAGQLHPAAPIPMPRQLEEFLEAFLLDAIARREQAEMRDRERDFQLSQRRHQLGVEPAGSEEIELPVDLRQACLEALDARQQLGREARLVRLHRRH